MPITIAGLVADPALGLRLVGGRDHGARPVLLAHTSELADPTPWLDGGELLMTLGLNLPAEPAGQDAYVARLAAAGVAGLAVDTGIVQAEVPSGIADAGTRHGLPILRVPAPTPFIAIARAVNAAIMSDQLKTVTEVSRAQERVAAAAMHSGPRGVVDVLAAAFHCPVALIGPTGAVTSAAGDAADLIARVGPLLADGARERRSHFAYVDDTGVITVQSIQARAGWLVIGSNAGLTTHERLVVSHAVTVLALLMRRPQPIMELEARLRQAASRALITLGIDPDPMLLAALGFARSPQIVVAVVDGLTRVDAAVAVVEEDLAHGGVARLVTTARNGLTLVLPAAEALPAIQRIVALLVDRLNERPIVGYSEPQLLTSIAPGLAQARAAARGTARDGRPSGYGDLGALEHLFRAQPAEALEALVRSTLGPLVAAEPPRLDLLEALEAFLAHNGHWGAAASNLGIHRHTLRQRLDAVERLLDRQLANSDHRGELWVALAARRHLRPERRPQARRAATPPDRGGGSTSGSTTPA